ncbi:MAG: hypothetical protein RLY78_1533 [Pseudomonadota bacterium]|jgi:hypothetical protein
MFGYGSTAAIRPCWVCRHFVGMDPGSGLAAGCGRDGGIRLCSMPEQGCAFWEHGQPAVTQAPPAFRERFKLTADGSWIAVAGPADRLRSD